MSDSYNKKSEKIRELANLPPDQLMNHLATTHAKLSEAAPGIAPQVNNVAVNGINFLNSKLPKPVTEFPGDEDLEPSKSQKEQWLQYHDSVNDPLKTLEHVKNGTLNSHHLEALQAVHPDLLHEMQQKVMENATPKNMKNLDYSTKIAVSKFLGSPMHQSMMPGVIFSDQSQFNLNPATQAAGTPQRKGVSEAGMQKMNVAKRTATQTQQLEEE
jgi:hypothetical protein